MKLADLVREFRYRAVYFGITNNILEPEITNAPSRFINPHFTQPLYQLIGRTYINDSTQTNPAVGCSAHRAMFARSIYCRLASFLRCHIPGCPARQSKFRMLGMLTTCNVIMVFRKHFSVG